MDKVFSRRREAFSLSSFLATLSSSLCSLIVSINRSIIMLTTPVILSRVRAVEPVPAPCWSTGSDPSSLGIDSCGSTLLLERVLTMVKGMV
jgi:hypothetical protein